MGALAASVDHVRFRIDARQRQAAIGVAVARAGTTHYHICYRVIIFLLQKMLALKKRGKFSRLFLLVHLDFLALVQQVVSEGMQFGEVYPQVGHFEEILHFF